MPVNRSVLPALLALALLTPAIADARPADDEAWIARYVEDARRGASKATHGAPGRELSLADLKDRKGTKVRVTLRDGRLRRGEVERADAGSLLLRVVLPSGYAHLRLLAGQVRSIALE